MRLTRQTLVLRISRSSSFLFSRYLRVTENTKSRQTIGNPINRTPSLATQEPRRRGCATFTAIFRFKFNVCAQIVLSDRPAAYKTCHLKIRTGAPASLNVAISPSSANAKPISSPFSPRKIPLYLRDHNFLFAPRAFPRARARAPVCSCLVSL